MSTFVNINADLGESFGAWDMGADAEMLQLVNSANIACGFHAGDPLVMQNTLRLAKAAGVSVGAHPSYPDLQGFGRRRMNIALPELEAMIIYQMAALAGMASAEGIRMTHVKPHGALNNAACEEPVLAMAVVRAIKALDGELILLAPALSCLCQAGYDAGLPVIEEIFADRAYLDDGRLVPRNRPEAMIHGAERALEHVEAMLQEQALISINGRRLPTKIGSVCVHGDGADAVRTAAYLRSGLSNRGYVLKSLPELLSERG